jgi:hypothetical protein
MTIAFNLTKSEITLTMSKIVSFIILITFVNNEKL